MNKANHVLIFINSQKPELIFAATEIMLQTPKGAQIIPCLFADIMKHHFHCEEIFVLEIEPKTDDEKKQLAEFIVQHKMLKLWSHDGKIFTPDGMKDSVGYAHELKKFRISFPEYLQKRANLIEIGQEDIADTEASRILKAIAVQKTFDFNIGKSDGYPKLLGKMITEIVTEQHDAEIEALANMRSELLKNTEKEKRLWSIRNLRDIAFRRNEFGGVITIDLQEINPFLLDVADIIKSIKAKKFIVEFSCSGYYRFLFVSGQEIISRRYHAEVSGKNKSRERAAKAFKKIENKI
ncbi:MAG: hypothetical protein HY931_01635 [Candidatus Falkowbacteria bacterium]|nr:MAG: hypothetical protein HY931_01635 [Candidatus Falkowbacteria bacterium]